MHLFWLGVILLLVALGVFPVLSVMAPGLLVLVFGLPILTQIGFVAVGLALIGLDLGNGKK